MVSNMVVVTMELTRSFSPLSRLLITLLFSLSLAGSSSTQTVAAWYNTLSSHVLVQDATTGNVYHSNCNSSGTPVFPTAPLNIFPFEDGKKPKNGSAFAVTGYYDDADTILVRRETRGGTIEYASYEYMPMLMHRHKSFTSPTMVGYGRFSRIVPRPRPSTPSMGRTRPALMSRLTSARRRGWP
jgi:hypothetical protein